MKLTFVVVVIFAAVVWEAGCLSTLARSKLTSLRRSPQQQQQQRAAAETALYQRLMAMTPQQVKQFQSSLSPAQRRQLVSRLRVLKQQEQSPGGANTILSGASPVRQQTGAKGSPNSVGGKTASAAAMVARLRTRMASIARTMARIAAAKKRNRRPKNAFDAMRKFQSYKTESGHAMGAGCTPPMGMESALDSFMAFSSGGCATGGMACYMSGKSCVDVGMSIMCCPPGYSSGTLSMLDKMKTMQSFMAQFS